MEKGVIFILIGFLLFTNLNLIESKEISTKATVNVNPIYELNIDIEIINDKIFSGENLSVFIELEKINLVEINEEIEVRLDYKILKNKNLIENGFLKSININDEKEEIIQIQVSPDLQGRYDLKIIVSNPQSFSDEDSEMFKVQKKPNHPFSRFILFLFNKPKPFLTNSFSDFHVK